MEKISDSNQKSNNNQHDNIVASRLKERVSFNSLSPEILGKIFKYLPHKERLRLEAVCKHWKIWSQETWKSVERIVLTASSERTKLITVTNYSIRLVTCDYSLIRKILFLCGHNIKYLTIDSTSEEHPCEIFPDIHKYCQNIEELEIEEEMSNEYNCKLLGELLKHNGKLKIAKITSYHEPNMNALTHLPHEYLEELRMPCLRFRIDTRPLARIIEKLRALRTLQISIDRNVLRSISKLTGLKQLEMFNQLGDIHDSDILHIIKLVNLENLECNGFSGHFTDNLLIELTSQCKKIQQLNFCVCNPGTAHNITARGLSAIASLPYLEELDISGWNAMNDQILVTLGKLKKLSCSECPRLTKIGIISLIESAENLEALTVSKLPKKDTEEMLNTAIEITKRRTNQKILTILVGFKNDNELRKANVLPFLCRSPFLHIYFAPVMYTLEGFFESSYFPPYRLLMHLLTNYGAEIQRPHNH